MSVLYLHTSPAPVIPGTDAIFNETSMLRDHFQGQEVVIFPFMNPSSYLPRFLYGWHKAFHISRLQKVVSLNHIFSPGLYYYPILSLLKKPVVYSVSAAIGDNDLLLNRDYFNSIDKILVNNQRDYQRLVKLELTNAMVIPPAVDTRKLHIHKLPFSHQLRLLMASAPWEESQLKTKGVEVLLEACRLIPSLHLTLLWRGRLVNQLENLIEKFGVGNQVKVINAHMDIQQVMDSVHATVLLSESASLVKAFPHSLVESLACGKPVLVSEEIAMSDYVKDKSVGLVVDGIDLASLLNQIDLLRSKYEMFRLNAEMVGGKDFSVDCMLEEMGKLYHEIDASI